MRLLQGPSRLSKVLPLHRLQSPRLPTRRLRSTRIPAGLRHSVIALSLIVLVGGCPNVRIQLRANPATLDFGGTTEVQTVRIAKNRSSREMAPLVVTSNVPWVEVLDCTSASDGCISNGPFDPITVSVQVNRSKMNTGDNRGVLRFTSQGAVSETVDVLASTVVSPSFIADNRTPFEDTDPVTFTNTTQVEPGWVVDRYQWDFGQGGRSTQENPPPQIYTTPGTYSVSLAVTVTRGEDRVTITSRESGYIVVSDRAEPTAAFEVSSVEPLANTPVFFTDTSEAGSSPIITWKWDFDGNGTTDSSLQNPSHIFEVGGEFEVTLRVESEHGIDETTQVIRVIARTPTADFRASSTTPPVNSTVQFEDLSIPGSAPIVEWEWDFGDGGSDSRKNPTHTYTEAGTFTITLRVIDSGGQEDTLTRNNYITASTAEPVADFDASRRRVIAGQTVTFIDQSDLTTAGPPTSTLPRYDWRFFNSDTGAVITMETRVGLQNPDVTINFQSLGFMSGLVDVELTVTTEHGSDTLRRNEFIGVFTGNALDEYLAEPETCDAFSIRNTIRDPQPDPVLGPRFVANVLLVQSQAWRTVTPCEDLALTDRGLWKHFVTVIDPTEVDNNTALLVLTDEAIDPNRPPTSVDPAFVDLAVSTRSIVAIMSAVPNQPLIVDGQFQVGDGLVAATLRQYLDRELTGELEEADQPVLFPMAKSAVAGMDAVQDYLTSIAGVDVEEFVLLGAATSNQTNIPLIANLGWTAWLAAAADPKNRVRGIAPVGFDFLNFNLQIEHQADTLGKISEVWAPYTAEGIFGSDSSEAGFFNRFDSPEGENLRALIDPYELRGRYIGVNQLIINASGDQYFPPDSSQFYINDRENLIVQGFDGPVDIEGLSGVANVSYIPGVNHAFGGTGAIVAMRFVPWYQMLLAGESLPEFDWRVVRTTNAADQIIVTPQDDPSRVTLYRATNFRNRDFRLDTLLNPSDPLPLWTPQNLSQNINGDFVGSITPNREETQWIAFFLQLEYDREDEFGDPALPLILTTDVVVTPDTLAPPDTGEPVGPQADFTANNRVVPANTPVQFTDLTIPGTAPISSWSWNFGDGTSPGAVRNPSHVYTEVGDYTVSLTVVTADGTDTETKEAFISVFVAPPVASFEASSRRPLVGTAVTFMDTSDPGSLPITERSWQFMDEDGMVIDTSTLANPTITFTEAGPITVSLTVTTGVGSNTATVEDFLTVFAPTALDTYLRNGDPFDYAEVAEISGPGGSFTATVLDLVSQTWRSAADVTQTLWNHWVTVIEPAVVSHSTAMLVISGGNYTDGMPESVPAEFALLANEIESVVVLVSAVPNQPLQFTDDPLGDTRSEDAIIAFTFRQFLDSYNESTMQGDGEWPALVPMTKAAIRAMDATEDFLDGEGVEIDSWVVTGASKRGWTTWLTAAADERVIAIAPLVYDALNFVPQIQHHFNTYGTFSSAVQDYVDEEIFFPVGDTFVNRLDSPEGEALLDIVDPYEYRGRFEFIPKLLFNSTGDQFFVPDSAQFYFQANPALHPNGFDAPLNIEGLPGEKKLAYIENTNHGLGRLDRVAAILIPWYLSVVENRELPQLSWQVLRAELPGENDLIVATVPDAASVNEARLWRAVAPVERDFRFTPTGPATGNPMWTVAEDLAVGSNIIAAELVLDPAFPDSLQAFFVEVEFEDDAGMTQFYTTEVVITPDELPAVE